MKFVLDNSVAMLWLIPTSNPQGAPFAEGVLRSMVHSEAWVPNLWSLECANVIKKAETKGLISLAQSQRFIQSIRVLPIHVDPLTASHALGTTLSLAREFKLSSYDAAYLELALRMGAPLATLDVDLQKAAKTAGLPPLPGVPA